MNPADGYTNDPDRLYPEVLADMDRRAARATPTPAMDVTGPQPGMSTMTRMTDFNRAKEAAMNGLNDIRRMNATARSQQAPATDPTELCDVERLVAILRDKNWLSQHEADTIADYLVSAYGIVE